MMMRTLALILCAATAVFVFGPGHSMGQSVWIAPNPGAWNISSNWSTRLPPTRSDSVAIVGAPGPVEVDSVSYTHLTLPTKRIV